MAHRHRARFVALTTLLADHPDVVDPSQAIVDQHVQVDGRIITNPRARVRTDAAIRITRPRPLRGEVKLSAGLDALGVDPSGLIVADLGAAAGGFTRTLLHRGARRVYAVDVGHGQLRGSLRQDPRVVNLEGTNIANLDHELIPDRLDLITADLSYLPVAKAIGQLHNVKLRPAARLVALVKPTFELGRGELVSSRDHVQAAIGRAIDGVESHGWTVIGVTVPATTGANGAVEAFLHAVAADRHHSAASSAKSRAVAPPTTDSASRRDGCARSANRDLSFEAMSAPPLREQVEALSWHHSIELPEGVVTPGQGPPAWVRAKLPMPERLDHKSVLDVGTWDGFYAFEAAKRGAKRVLATDSYVWDHPHLPGDAGFQLARRALGLEQVVDQKRVDVMDLSPETVGESFDVVLFLGVLYHLTDPIVAIERVSSVCDDLLVLETEIALNRTPFPAARVYVDKELNHDDTNWFAFNERALRSLLHRNGFSRVEVHNRTPFTRRVGRGVRAAIRREAIRPLIRSNRITLFAWR